MAGSIVTHPGTARRALRAFAQAGLEILLAACFTAIAFLLLPTTLDRFSEDFSLVQLKARVTMHFWEWEADRLERTEATLKQIMPRKSIYRAYEVDRQPSTEFNQTIVVEVEYRNLTAYFDFISLSFDLAMGNGGHRGASYTELVKLRGPSQLAAAFALHLVLVPWLLLRFCWLPRNCPPAKPLLPRLDETRRTLALCAAAGLVLGVLVPVVFNASLALGLLHFSDRMPDLEMLGVTPELLWQTAIVIALAGAVEEAFFRGLLLRHFVQNGLQVLGVFVCAVWFTLIHFSYFSWDSGNITYLLWIGTMGLGLGFLTLRHGTWVPAAIAHAGYNFTTILLAGLLNLAV